MFHSTHGIQISERESRNIRVYHSYATCSTFLCGGTAFMNAQGLTTAQIHG